MVAAVSVIGDEIAVIERCDDCFSCARCGDNEIFVLVADGAVGPEAVKDRLLVRVGIDVEDGTGLYTLLFFLIRMPGKIQLLCEFLAFGRSIGLKIHGVPVVFKGCIYLANSMWLVVSCNFQIPLQTA